jgi:hypothetical protein
MQAFTLNFDAATANALIAALEVARRQGDFAAARTAVSIISEIIRQDEEFKAAQAVESKPEESPKN